MKQRIILLLCFFILSITCARSALSAKQNLEVASQSKKKAVAGETMEGVLVDLNIRKKFFNMSVKRQQTVTMFVDKDTVFTKDNKSIFFSDLFLGDALEIIYEVKGKKKIAQSVRVKSSGLWRRSYRGLYGY